MSTLFPFAPNWRSGYEVQFEYKTDIFASYDGTEQRRAQRVKARREIKFTPLERQDKARAMWALLTGEQDQVINVPDYSQRQRLAAPLATLGTVATVDVVPSWAVAGARVILDDGDNMQVFDILGVVGQDLTFATASDFDFGLSTRVHPGLETYMAASVRASFHTSEVWQAPFTFHEFPGENYVPDPVAWPSAYKSLPLFDRQPDWGERPKVRVVDTRGAADFQKGKVALTSPRDFSSQILQFGHTGKDSDSSAALVDFYRSQRGRQGEFWLPSWTDDMALAATFASGGVDMLVSGEFAALVLDDPAHRNVVITLKNGTKYYREVSSVVISGVNSQLTLDASLPVTLNPEDVNSISWLYRARFANDRMSFKWLTSTVVDTTMNFQILRETT